VDVLRESLPEQMCLVEVSRMKNGVERAFLTLREAFGQAVYVR
jgi:hypothetical protein